MLPFSHSETINLDISYLDKLNSDNKKYTFNKKELLHAIHLKNVIDVNLQYYMEYNVPLNVDDISTLTHNFFNNKFYNRNNLNSIIPTMKHLEYCRKLSNELKKHINLPVHEYYNNDVLNNLQYIESNGLKTLNDIVFSEYNLYTSTGRPSNRFGGVNFAALNKKDGSRKPYISRFGTKGMLVELDYDAYHLRLIGNLIGYEFPKGSVHEHMAKFYGCDYKESKNRSFKYLYGRIPIEVVQMNPFFSKVHDYINEIWSGYKKEDFITSNIYSKKIYRKNLSNMNKNKLFNYLIQLTETENNMRMLTDLISHLKEFKYESKLVLYSYDSFLFDFNMNDGTVFLNAVKSIIEQLGKYPTKVSKGTNYHNMEDITEKLA
tara:strand:- start:22 stop:1149 length:1128 start_codon:yes stop_codon:yes gene_type:complete